MINQVKRIKISNKNQITIPSVFMNLLGFKDKADCYVQDGCLIVKPTVPIQEDIFAEEILADLITQGYSGENLLVEFKKIKANIPTAISSFIKESEENAVPLDFEELFGNV